MFRWLICRWRSPATACSFENHVKCMFYVWLELPGIDEVLLYQQSNSKLRILTFFFFLILITLTWYQSWFYKTRLNLFFLERYFVFRLCKIGYFVFPSAFAIWYLRSVSTIILVFRLPFSLCNLVFVISFCKFVFCFGVIV
jgi:hypothetical protein